MPDSKTRRPVVPDDLFRLQLIQDARLSPDGTTVVYALAQTDEGGAHDHTALWLVSLESGETRQLTAGTTRDWSPQWSPDGKWIAFLSARSIKAQIFLIALNGGEARQLTRLLQGVGGAPQWSPDGKWIAFPAGPERPSDLSQPYRLTRNVYRFDELGYLDGSAQDIFVVDAEGGEPRRLTDDRCNNTMPQWSPDGRELLFNASLPPDSYLPPYPRLRVVTLDGAARDLTGDWGYSVAAAWLPDRRVVFCGQPYGRPAGSKNDIWVVGQESDAPSCRSAELPLHLCGGLQSDMPVALAPLTRLLVSPGGDAVYAQAQHGGTVELVRVGLSGASEWAAVLHGERTCIPLDLRGERLLFGVSKLDSPLELHTAALDGSDQRQISDVNADALDEWHMPAIERLQFTGADGVEVEGWLMLPPGGTAPHPLVLYIHGGPHSGFGHIFSFDFQMLAGAGYAVLLVNQRGSTGYGDAFATRIVGDWGNHDYHDLLAGVDAAIERGLADPNRLGVCGLSGGGNLTCWIIGQTDRFKAAVPENPVTNWLSFYGVSDIGPWFAQAELGGPPHELPEVYRRCSPISYAHRCVTPTLLIQGEADYRCPAEQSEQFYTVLKANGCTVEMLRLPASSHAGSIRGTPQLRRAQNEALLEWIQRYV
jgi:dipeptidyl aminopeptidase/acylaminoacyl peptidase